MSTPPPPRIRVASHALWRARVRLGVREDWEVYLWAARALQEGLPRERTTGILRAALDRRHARHGGTYLVLEGVVFVFDAEKTTLVTLLDLPPVLRAEAEEQEKQARASPPED